MNLAQFYALSLNKHRWLLITGGIIDKSFSLAYDLPNLDFIVIDENVQFSYSDMETFILTPE
jgi:hypothetical protein